jgi:hypothetical protein
VGAVKNAFVEILVFDDDISRKVRRIVSLVLVVPLCVRKVLKGNLSFVGIVNVVLTIFLAAGYIKVLFTGGDVGPLRLSTGSASFALVGSILFS